MAGLKCSPNPNPNLHSQKACNCMHRCPDTQVHICAHSFQLVRTPVGSRRKCKSQREFLPVTRKSMQQLL